jgi:hypothetical protein
VTAINKGQAVPQPWSAHTVAGEEAMQLSLRDMRLHWRLELTNLTLDQAFAIDAELVRPMQEYLAAEMPNVARPLFADPDSPTDDTFFDDVNAIIREFNARQLIGHSEIDGISALAELIEEAVPEEVLRRRANRMLAAGRGLDDSYWVRIFYVMPESFYRDLFRFIMDDPARPYEWNEITNDEFELRPDYRQRVLDRLQAAIDEGRPQELLEEADIRAKLDEHLSTLMGIRQQERVFDKHAMFEQYVLRTFAHELMDFVERNPARVMAQLLAGYLQLWSGPGRHMPFYYASVFYKAHLCDMIPQPVFLSLDDQIQLLGESFAERRLDLFDHVRAVVGAVAAVDQDLAMLPTGDARDAALEVRASYFAQLTQLHIALRENQAAYDAYLQDPLECFSNWDGWRNIPDPFDLIPELGDTGVNDPMKIIRGWVKWPENWRLDRRQGHRVPDENLEIMESLFGPNSIRYRTFDSDGRFLGFRPLDRWGISIEDLGDPERLVTPQELGELASATRFDDANRSYNGAIDQFIAVSLGDPSEESFRETYRNIGANNREFSRIWFGDEAWEAGNIQNRATLCVMDDKVGPDKFVLTDHGVLAVAGGVLSHPAKLGKGVTSIADADERRMMEFHERETDLGTADVDLFEQPEEGERGVRKRLEKFYRDTGALRKQLHPSTTTGGQLRQFSNTGIPAQFNEVCPPWMHRTPANTKDWLAPQMQIQDIQNSIQRFENRQPEVTLDARRSARSIPLRFGFQHRRIPGELANQVPRGDRERLPLPPMPPINPPPGPGALPPPDLGGP